jgi:hypothetical protein
MDSCLWLPRPVREECVMASASHSSPAIPPPSKAVLRRAIGASAIGNAVEWFDYGIRAGAGRRIPLPAAVRPSPATA